MSEWVYVAGHPSYPEAAYTPLSLRETALVLSGLNPPLEITYKDIEGYDLIPQKQITAGRVFLAGAVLGAALKKSEWLMLLRFRDDVGVVLSVVLETDTQSEVSRMASQLYQKLRESKSRK